MLFYVKICLAAGVIAVAIDSIAVTAIATRSVKFRSKRANEKLLCAIDSADVSIPVRSRIECSIKCQKDVKCLAINYKDDNPHLPVCEIYYYHDISPNFAVLPNCAHFQHLQNVQLIGYIIGHSMAWVRHGITDGVISKLGRNDDFSTLDLKQRTQIIDCSTIRASGIVQSGVYNATAGGQSFPVYCDMDTDGGGWTVFQRRQDGSVDFYRDWYNYTNGFGDLTEEFWLGNEYIHLLTSSSDLPYELRFDMADFENATRYAKYSNFVVGSGVTYYNITFDGFIAGDAGDSFSAHNGMMFTTFDSDHDVAGGNCAAEYKGAYWYHGCHQSNLNGLCLRGNQTQYAVGNVWCSWHGYYYSLRSVEMKIRQVV